MALSWHSWLVGFGLTLFLEVPIVVWLLGDAVESRLRRLAIAIFANLLTHPLVWFFFPQLPIAHAWQLTLSEVWAFAAEALFYFTLLSPMKLTQASLLSLSANLVSFGFGWIITGSLGQWLF